MEWLDQRTDLLKRDRLLFGFHPDHPCVIETIRLRGGPEGVVESTEKTLNSGQQYDAWVQECQPPSAGVHDPVISLVMHQRLNVEFKKTTSVPYGEETFRRACKGLFQHKSMALALPRTSTAVFNSRFVNWTVGRSIVYNCKSDTESPTDDTDFIMSVTYFTDMPMTYVVMYGCTQKTITDVKAYLRNMKSWTYHPLIFPMLFAELERKRLLNALDRKGAELKQRILRMENKLRDEDQAKTKKEEGNLAITKSDCEATRLWLSISSLRNGLASLKTHLVSMTKHSEMLSRTEYKSDCCKKEREFGDIIKSRLQEMVEEFESKVGCCDGLLGGMGLATQMEWNYYARRDAKTNIIIAYSSKRDSSQMRYISFLGMIFLPGTFLATLFSMTFFKWNPDESNQIISPWIAVYGALTLIFTGGTVWWWKKWTEEEVRIAKEELRKELDSDNDSPV